MTASDLAADLLGLERNTRLRLSPDGRRIGFVRTVDGGQEVWAWESGRERRLAAHDGGTVADLRWTADGSRLLYRVAERGREHWSLNVHDIAAEWTIRLEGPGPVSGYWPADHDPAAMAVACRPPGSKGPSLYLVDLDRLGADPVPLAGDLGFHEWLVDGALRPRGGVRLVAGGATEVHLGEDLDSAEVVLTVEPEALPTFAVLRFSRDRRRLFVLSSGGAATRRLIALTAEGGPTVLFDHGRLDIESYPIAGHGVWFDPRTGDPDLCTVMGQRLEHHVLAPDRRRAFDHLAPAPDRSPVIVDRSEDDRVHLTCEVRTDGPLRYRLVETMRGRSEPVMLNRPAIDGHPLPALEDFVFTASDGLSIPGHLLRPLDVRPPYPTVVLVHGGPAGRDQWRFHAEAQYLAALGCLSLHVNYRGSRGFGTRFRRAGDGEWGGRMQEDLYDAVAHGVERGLVDPGRVAFFGASYGGYAALLAACTRPELVQCAVAISPPCDLVRLAAQPPRYWGPLAASLRRQILERADGSTPTAAELRRRSPMHVIGRTCPPLLLAHGQRDPRVPVAGVDDFAGRAQSLGVRVEYLRFADEGHHVKADRNRATLFERVRAFLEEHLGIEG